MFDFTLFYAINIAKDCIYVCGFKHTAYIYSIVRVKLWDCAVKVCRMFLEYPEVFLKYVFCNDFTLQIAQFHVSLGKVNFEAQILEYELKVMEVFRYYYDKLSQSN